MIDPVTRRGFMAGAAAVAVAAAMGSRLFKRSENPCAGDVVFLVRGTSNWHRTGGPTKRLEFETYCDFIQPGDEITVKQNDFLMPYKVTSVEVVNYIN